MSSPTDVLFRELRYRLLPKPPVLGLSLRVPINVHWRIAIVTHSTQPASLPNLPKLSVVTVSFRDPIGLKVTRASVLAQDYPGELEHIIIDGGSGDEVVEWLSAQDSSLVWVSEPDGGIYDAMNKGAALASGDVLWFMNSADAFSGPDVAAHAMGLLDSPRTQWVLGKSHWINPTTGKIDSVHGPARYSRLRHMMGQQVVPHQASAVGIELFRTVGGYRTDIGIAADQIFMVECASQVAPQVSPRVLCDFDITGVGSKQTRAQHFAGTRQSRRKAGVTFTGSQLLDDGLSYGLQVIDPLWHQLGVLHKKLRPPRKDRTVRPHSPVTRSFDRVSVVIPTHNRDEKLAAGLAALQAQGSLVHEVIVVDDTGSDTTRQVVEAARPTVPTIYIDASTMPKRGPSASRNRGAAEVSTEVIAFVDDDDTWDPGYLEKALGLINDGADIAITWSRRMRNGKEYRGSLFDITKDHYTGYRFWSYGVTGSNIVLAAEAFHAVGGFDDDLWNREDQDLFVRLLNASFRYSVNPEIMVTQSADGASHLAGKSLRAAQSTLRYIEKHSSEFDAKQRRAAQRHYHAMSSGKVNTVPQRIYHRIMMVLNSNTDELKMMTIGRLTGARPARLIG